MTRTPRTQAGVAYACDRLVESRGGTVHRIGRGRSALVQSPDLPERRYQLGEGRSLWWYPRTERGVITRGELAFARREYDGMQIIGAGTDVVLRRVLADLEAGNFFAARVLAFDLLVHANKRANEPSCPR